MAGSLDGRVNDGDPTDPYYSLSEERSEDKEESEDDEDGDDESSDEDGEGKSSYEEGITVDEDGKGVPLNGCKSRILLGNK